MAELAKKFHFKKNGTDQQAKLYTTTAEAGSDNTPIKVDGATVYVALGPTSDSRATLGRMKKSNGSTVAVLTAGKPPYNKVNYTTAGTYTWTCPQGVTTAKVTVAGGGGGGLFYLQNIESSNSAMWYGGQGALVTQTVAVNAGQAYSIVVGAGGTGAFKLGSASVTASSGGTSSALGVSAQGGGGAKYGANGTSYGSGGSGGVASNNGGTGWVYIEYGGDI